MTEIQMNHRAGSVSKATDDISLIDILIVLAERKKIIVVSVLVFTLATVLVSFLMSPVFRTSATILPPQQQQSAAAALMTQLGAASAGLSSLAGLKSPGDVYIGILKSRTLADGLVERFGLAKHYDIEGSREKTLAQLEKNTEIKSSKEGLITISVSDADPSKAAQIANGYIDELRRLTSVLAVTQASRSRLFYEKELKQAKDNLAQAEVLLKRGLDAGGVVSVDIESRTILETIARFRAQISAKEVQLNAMNSFVTTNNQDYKRIQEELTSLKRQLARLEGGRQNEAANDVGAAREGFENMKTLRDVKYYQMLYELLAKQYEFARLEEAKDPTLIQVLDTAAVPERKIRPRPVLYALIGMLAGLLVGIGGAIAFDRFQQESADAITNEKLARLRRSIRG